jgi:hypothetical protein
VSTLNARQKNLLTSIGSGTRSFAPEDFSHSPDRLTRLVAFQTVVSDIDELFYERLITRPDKDVKGFGGGFYVISVSVERLTPLGMDVLDVQKPGWNPGGPPRNRSGGEMPPGSSGGGH